MDYIKTKYLGMLVFLFKKLSSRFVKVTKISKIGYEFNIRDEVTSIASFILNIL